MVYMYVIFTQCLQNLLITRISKKMKTFTDDQNIQTTVVHLENVEKKVHVEV